MCLGSKKTVIAAAVFIATYSLLSPAALTDPFYQASRSTTDLAITVVLKKRSDGSFCILNTTQRPDLVPSFANPSQYKSNVLSTAFSNLPLCDSDEEGLIKEYAANAFLINEGIQVAAGPMIALPYILREWGFGCAVGAIDYQHAKNNELYDPDDDGIFELFSSTFTVALFQLPAHVGVFVKVGSKVAAAVAIAFLSASVSAIGGFFSTIVCSNSVYYITDDIHKWWDERKKKHAMDG